MNDYRCIKCHKLLCVGDIEDGRIEVKCSKCGKINIIDK